MAVKELRIVEERCDRCELLIARKQVSGDEVELVEKEQAKNMGSFILKDDDGAIIIRYDVVCDRCRLLLDNLIKKMGKVNRGTRNRSSKKKKVEPDTSKKETTSKKKK